MNNVNQMMPLLIFALAVVCALLVAYISSKKFGMKYYESIKRYTTAPIILLFPACGYISRIRGGGIYDQIIMSLILVLSAASMYLVTCYNCYKSDPHNPDVVRMCMREAYYYLRVVCFMLIIVIVIMLFSCMGLL